MPTIEIMAERDLWKTRAEKAEAELSKLEAQESMGMEATLHQMLSKAQQEEWGFDKQKHPLNIQLMFVRACVAIDTLETELFARESKLSELKKDARELVCMLEWRDLNNRERAIVDRILEETEEI